MSQERKQGPRRIAFFLNALAGDELTSGNRDVARMYTVLTSPEMGMCVGPKPIHEGQNQSEFSNNLLQVLSSWRLSDQLVFYFSGHGEVRRGIFGLQLGIAKTESVPFDNILNILTASGVSRVIILLDTCHSGAAIRGKSGSSPLDTIQIRGLLEGIAILASSRATELSEELDDGTLEGTNAEHL